MDPFGTVQRNPARLDHQAALEQMKMHTPSINSAISPNLSNIQNSLEAKDIPTNSGPTGPSDFMSSQTGSLGMFLQNLLQSTPTHQEDGFKRPWEDTANVRIGNDRRGLGSTDPVPRDSTATVEGNLPELAPNSTPGQQTRNPGALAVAQAAGEIGKAGGNFWNSHTQNKKQGEIEERYNEAKTHPGIHAGLHADIQKQADENALNKDTGIHSLGNALGGPLGTLIAHLITGIGSSSKADVDPSKFETANTFSGKINPQQDQIVQGQTAAGLE